MSILTKNLVTILLLLLFTGCFENNSEEPHKKVTPPNKITYLFVTQPSCPSCDKLEESMSLERPKKLLSQYFEVKKLYLGEKIPDGLPEPNGTPTVYFLGANNEVLVEPMIGEKSEKALMEFLEDALLEFNNTYHVDLRKKGHENSISKKRDSKEKIANIPEASGISYCSNSNTLIVANDEGSLYELTTNGKILLQQKLGEYDLEGVVCEEKEFTFAVEGGSLLVVNRKTLEKKEFKVRGKEVKIGKKDGIEGIVKIDNLYYLSIQSKKKMEKANLLHVKLGSTYAKITEVINHRVIDSAGLEYRNNLLYIVSDKKDKLYLYDLKQEKVLKKIKLPKFAQEGITFDNSGNVYFADDNGAVFKYRVEEFGL